MYYPQYSPHKDDNAYTSKMLFQSFGMNWNSKCEPDPIGQHWGLTSLMWLNERKFPQLCFNISWKMSQKSGSSSWRTNSLYVLDFEIKCKTSNNIILKTKSMDMLILNGWKLLNWFNFRLGINFKWVYLNQRWHKISAHFMNVYSIFNLIVPCEYWHLWHLVSFEVNLSNFVSL